MTWREMVGWGLAVYVASPLLRSKGGTFEALTAVGTAFLGAAAAWGYTGKRKV